MGHRIQLTSKDGHQLSAYIAEPDAAARGGLVVAMEMYGVNDYLTGVCDGWAADGYLAIAPLLWDRYERDLTLPYDEAGSARGKAMSLDIAANMAATLDDLAAAADRVRNAGKVGIVGFCLGGTVAWLAACRRDFDAALPYYGSNMCDYPDDVPRCPVLCHVGALDTAVPPDDIAAFAASRPEPQWCVYDGVQHGFDNSLRPARHDRDAASLARERSRAFLAEHVG